MRIKIRCTYHLYIIQSDIIVGEIINCRRTKKPSKPCGKNYDRLELKSLRFCISASRTRDKIVQNTYPQLA